MFPEPFIGLCISAAGGATHFKHKLVMEGQRPKQKGGQRVCEILSSGHQHPYFSPVVAVFQNISEGSED